MRLPRYHSVSETARAKPHLVSFDEASASSSRPAPHRSAQNAWRLKMPTDGFSQPMPSHYVPRPPVRYPLWTAMPLGTVISRICRYRSTSQASRLPARGLTDRFHPIPAFGFSRARRRRRGPTASSCKKMCGRKAPRQFSWAPCPNGAICACRAPISARATCLCLPAAF